VCRPFPGGKTEDFISAAKLFHRAKRQVKVPTYLVPATQKVGRKVCQAEGRRGNGGKIAGGGC
jgi:3-isopropylmalate/(R)-2-methylmalate dehydratase large subunit